MISAEQIASLMSKEGPVVRCVMLRAAGPIEELSLDMTPKKNAMVGLFGGQPSIVGQFQVLDTVVLKMLDADPAKHPKNAHKLPHPLHAEEHYGDLLLVRMNEESEPESFTKEEWTEFLKDAPFTAEAYEAWKAKNKVRDEAEDEDDDDEQDEAEIEAFLQIFRRNFQEENGRPPTEEEESEVKRAMIEAGDEGEEEAGENSLTPEEEEVLNATVEKLQKKLKRDATDEEIAEALKKVKGGLEILRKVEAAAENDDDDDDEAGDLTGEEQATISDVVSRLTTRLKRNPSGEEIYAALKVLPGGLELASKINLLAGAEEDDNEEEDDEEEEEEEEEEEDDEDEDYRPKQTKRARRG